MNIAEIKSRFGIIGNSPVLEHAINVAKQVAPTEISVLINGESGVGKEVFPQIIHQLSARKHGPYIAVNCGAIPEGTIDSELFGHEKGSFTGATEARKGYFEVVDGGTIFLDEVGDLPMNTQVRLLRVLETGEMIRVGSSKVQKTNVRVVAATNVDLLRAIENGKFREDLYYRLNTVPIRIPPLRDRKEDIFLLFRKFASDFSDRYRVPSLILQPEAQKILIDYRWPGNIRQLKNITEQMSILEKNREINADTLMRYLPPAPLSNLPALIPADGKTGNDFSERDLLYKVLFDMKKEMNDVKLLMSEMMKGAANDPAFAEKYSSLLGKMDHVHSADDHSVIIQSNNHQPTINVAPIEQHHEVEESLSLADKEKEFIQKALAKHHGRRRPAARELGISERTLYRKMHDYNLQ